MKNLFYPWPSESAIDTTFFQPFSIEFARLQKWLYQYKTWKVSVNISTTFPIGSAPYYSSGDNTVTWNRTNNPFTVGPAPDGTPPDANFLGLGWAFAHYLVPYNLGGNVFNFVLFDSFLSSSSHAGRGMSYSYGGSAEPYMQFNIGGASCKRGGTSPLLVTIDSDIVIPMEDEADFITAGTVDITPFEFW